MPEYRKNTKSKIFYKYDDSEKVTTEVDNRFHWSSVKSGYLPYTHSNVFGVDPEILTVPCTEEEFNAAKSEAMKRLQSEQI